MIIDLIHNKIVADTITDAFVKSVENKLVPDLEAKYGNTEIVGIQMYEDYLSDNFMKNGYWYYPLTVVTADGCFTEWVKWAVNADNYDRGVPYSYRGEESIDFKLTANVPAEFEDKLVGRARFCEGGIIKLNIETSATDITKLSGKYSQTFVDELARQITAAISSAMSVKGLADSELQLSLAFAAGTYMEHISENITYRRLILSDKSSAPRDFWIKWTRLDGAVSYSVASNVDAENILFELGEDVSQKVREKEYRYLVQAGKDKYHNAMGRKNVTEWREIIKRAIRRGELDKVEETLELTAEALELQEKLADVLDRAGVAVPQKDNEQEVTPNLPESDEFERAMQKMREVAFAESSDDDAVAPVIPSEEESVVEDTAEVLVLTEDVNESTKEKEDSMKELVLTNEDETSEDAAEELAMNETETALGDEIPEEENTAELVTDDAEKSNEKITFGVADEAEEEVREETMVQVEFFDEEDEEEDEEELDELEALYADDEVTLEVSEGAVPINDEEAAELDEITKLALEALKEIKERALAEENTEDTKAEETAPETNDDSEFEEIFDEEALYESEAEESIGEDEQSSLDELRMLEPDGDDSEEVIEEDEEIAEVTIEESVEEVEERATEEEIPVENNVVEEAMEGPVISSEREQDIRAEIEAKIRFEYESRARKTAEEETARLRREQEAMRIENERLLAEARREQERLRVQYEELLANTRRINAEREEKERLRRAEEEKLRAQIEMQLRQEARERERLAEAARIAIEEQRRLEEENVRREAERVEEERRIEQEKLRREAEARAIAERAKEAERIRREEEAAKAAAAAAMPTAGDGKYSYTSKTVRFIFRKSVDPNITTRIHEIIKAAIEYYGKDKVFMKIRATVPDSQTVNLEFLQIPIEEMELLSNLIKILGNSGLGIAKAIVE